MTIKHCPVCDSQSFQSVVLLSERRAAQYVSVAHAEEVPKSRLDLEGCTQCGLVRQKPSSEVRKDYSHISRATTRQLPHYVNDIIAGLSKRGVGKDDPVLEVGANEGSFMLKLREAGFTNIRGVEPSEDLSQLAIAKDFEVDCDYFTAEFATAYASKHGRVAAIVCRHTLEHVPDIRDMVLGFSRVLKPNGVVFIEVPDFDWVVGKLLTHEIWDEHITYFRAGSLSRLVSSLGMSAVNLERIRFRDTRNLMCWCVNAPNVSDAHGYVDEDATLPDELASFQARWDGFVQRIQRRLENAPRPVVVVGASHIQINFLNFAGLDQHVDMMIDDDPFKAGKYVVLGKTVPVVSTAEALEKFNQGTILLTAFPYPEWQQKICATLEDRATFIDPELLK